MFDGWVFVFSGGLLFLDGWVFDFSGGAFFFDGWVLVSFDGWVLVFSGGLVLSDGWVLFFGVLVLFVGGGAADDEGESAEQAARGGDLHWQRALAVRAGEVQVGQPLQDHG